MDRKRVLRKRIRAFLLLFILACLVDAVFIEPRWVKVEQVPIHLERLPEACDGLRIVHLTDIHYPRGLNEEYFRGVVRKTNALRPDLILMTGDFAPRSANDAVGCANVLAGLHAPLGVYSVLGNHDYWTDADAVTRELTGAGIKVLQNESTPIHFNGARIWLVGLDDFCERLTDPDKALAGVPPGECKIMLLHEPDYADIADEYSFDLQLSGHSHGGLVSFPLLGTPFAPKYSRKYSSGYYQVGKLQLYTNRGIGVIPIFGLPMRFNCRPEIALITLLDGGENAMRAK